MTPISVVIVDDEPLARRGIRQHLAPHDDVAIAGEAPNGRDAVRLLKALGPDLVFLDIQMPELDGFGVIRELEPEQVPLIIFVTAYDTFAVRAFESHAVDYLVKPVPESRFLDAMSRARERLRARRPLLPSYAPNLHAGWSSVRTVRISSSISRRSSGLKPTITTRPCIREGAVISSANRSRPWRAVSIAPGSFASTAQPSSTSVMCPRSARPSIATPQSFCATAPKSHSAAGDASRSRRQFAVSPRVRPASRAQR